VQATSAPAPAPEAPDRPSAQRRPPLATPGRGRRLAQSLVFLVPPLLVAVIGFRQRFVTEDGFIYLRIVDNLTAGNGPVFNAGERVEAYTGTAWVFILAVGDLLTPIRQEFLSVGIGLLCTVGGLLLATLGARRLWQPEGEGRFWLPLGAAVFASLYPTWTWATGGLETGFLFGWLGLCTWILGTWASSPKVELRAWRLVVLGSGWLVRPEMMLFSLVFLALVAVSQRTTARRVQVVGVGLSLAVAYQLFRMAYFGSLLTNTAIAKEGSRLNVDRGWRYFRDFTDPYYLWIAALGLVLALAPLLRSAFRKRHRRRIGVVAALVGAGTLNVLYVIAVGGDYHHARMFLPGLLAACATVAAVPVKRSTAPAVVIVSIWAVVAVITLRPEQLAGPDSWYANGFIAQVPATYGNVTIDDVGMAEGDDGIAWYTGSGYFHATGGYLIVSAPIELAPGVPDPFASLWGVGMAAYGPGIDLHVLDQLGLADHIASHLDISEVGGEELRGPGHEKPLPAAWVAARVTPEGAEVDPVNFPDFYTPLIPPAVDADELAERVAWARAALECDEIAALDDAATEPLGVGRLADNLFGSFRNTFVRIPPDPEEAYRRFCGDGVPPEVEAARGG
jgi:arabinofuranosyltransferase